MSADERRRVIALLEERQDDATFDAAKRVLDTGLAAGETAELLLDYGYVHECRGRTSIREAIGWYRRAIEADPTNERAHHQLILAHAALHEQQDMIALYERRLAEAPTDLAAYRLLASAYLAGGEYEKASEVVEAGLALEPDDPGLLVAWGSVLEGRGRPDEALATWQRVFELEGDRHASSLYSRVFLLQRLGRLEEAAAEWETLIAWLVERGFTIEAEWPRRELASLRARLEAPG